jgi:hypothetical protein
MSNDKAKHTPDWNEVGPALLEALKLAQEMNSYALGKFNWGASALDAKAIDLLNRAPIAVSTAIAKAEGGAP